MNVRIGNTARELSTTGLNDGLELDPSSMGPDRLEGLQSALFGRHDSDARPALELVDRLANRPTSSWTTLSVRPAADCIALNCLTGGLAKRLILAGQFLCQLDKPICEQDIENALR